MVLAIAAIGFGVVSGTTDRTPPRLAFVLAVVLVGGITNWRWARARSVPRQRESDGDAPDMRNDARMAAWILGSGVVTAVLLATDAGRSEIGGWVTAASAAVMALAIFWFWATR